MVSGARHVMSKDEGRDALLRVLSNGGAASGAAGGAANGAGDGAAGGAADAGLLDGESTLVDRSDEVWALDAATRAPMVASFRDGADATMASVRALFDDDALHALPSQSKFVEIERRKLWAN